MKEILTVFMLILAVYPLKTIYTLFRICKKRKNSLNMFLPIAFSIFYLIVLFKLNNLSLQFSLIVITALISNKLIKKVYGIDKPRRKRKRLDSFEAFIKQQKRTK